MECPICFDDDEPLVKLSCSHRVCAECIYGILNHRNKSCPLCRRDIFQSGTNITFSFQPFFSFVMFLINIPCRISIFILQYPYFFMILLTLPVFLAFTSAFVMYVSVLCTYTKSLDPTTCVATDVIVNGTVIFPASLIDLMNESLLLIVQNSVLKNYCINKL